MNLSIIYRANDGEPYRMRNYIPDMPRSPLAPRYATLNIEFQKCTPHRGPHRGNYYACGHRANHARIIPRIADQGERERERVDCEAHVHLFRPFVRCAVVPSSSSKFRANPVRSLCAPKAARMSRAEFEFRKVRKKKKKNSKSHPSSNNTCPGIPFVFPFFRHRRSSSSTRIRDPEIPQARKKIIRARRPLVFVILSLTLMIARYRSR